LTVLSAGTTLPLGGGTDMANIVRRNDQGELAPRATAIDPFQLLRDMMTWDPFRQLTPFRQALQEQQFAPQFEVKETNDAYIFKADLPGVDEADLDISLTGNRLVVSGRREAEQRQEGETFFAYERSYGTFSRSFTLPEGIDADHVEAELKNGVLMIKVPKHAEHQPKKISLKSVAEKVKGVFGKDKDKGSA
jgi:HSP20 family protein